MAGFKLHDYWCACWHCTFEDNWFHYLPTSYRVYNGIMMWVRYYIIEHNWTK